MAFPIQILLIEPEGQSAMFLLGNVLLFMYMMIFVISWPYILIYLIVQIIIFQMVNQRLRSGRSYIPTTNLSNQTVIVTGAATGIGRATALELAKLRARVIVGIRNQARAERIAQELSKQSNGNVIGYHLDLSDLSSVKDFAQKIDKVDILINNAGVVKKQKEYTKDGLESTFGTNHIGPFYLTQLLLPLLIKSHGRIVNVSSIMHILSKEDTDFVQSRSYNLLTAYADSKLANIFHASELLRRYGDQGVRAYALHPGSIASTELGGSKAPLEAILTSPLQVISKSMPQGAMTTLFCALSDKAQPGKYHSNCRVTRASPLACNPKKAQELWELSEQIINDKTKSF